MKTRLLSLSGAFLLAAGATHAGTAPSITMDIAGPPPEFFSSNGREMVLPVEMSAVRFRLQPYSPATQTVIEGGKREIFLPPSGGRVPIGNGVGYTLLRSHYKLVLDK